MQTCPTKGSLFMNLADVLFYLLAVLTGLSAIAVVVTQNIVRAATWLLFALAGTAGIFFLLGADFIGATQLLGITDLDDEQLTFTLRSRP